MIEGISKMNTKEERAWCDKCERETKTKFHQEAGLICEACFVKTTTNDFFTRCQKEKEAEDAST